MLNHFWQTRAMANSKMFDHSALYPIETVCGNEFAVECKLYDYYELWVTIWTMTEYHNDDDWIQWAFSFLMGGEGME